MEARDGRPLRDRRSKAGFFSTVATFALPQGSHIEPGGLRGYYIDLRVKAETPRWPALALPPYERRLHVVSAQWGLGAFERYVAGEGEAWLDAARRCADELVDRQTTDGPLAGSWLHGLDYEHTFPLRAPWISAMAQGEAASLLVRIHREVGDDRYADAAAAAMQPLDLDVADGGTRAWLDGGPFPEEYPTVPSSFVLNGAVFAIWGMHDVAVALGEREARERFEASVDTLAASLPRWDWRSWSRYDLFPHPVPNVASSFYHDLHVKQLRMLALMAPRPVFGETAQRWSRSAASTSHQRRAFVSKAIFRGAVPRQPRLARLLPWSPMGK